MHRILMAADNYKEVEFLKTGSEKAGLAIEIIHAQTVSQVIHHLSAAMPSIIFLDLRLSTAYSWHIIEQIRQRAIYNDIPIVMYAGAGDATLMQDGFRKGADLVLNKTADVVKLGEALDNIFTSDWKSLKQQRLARKLCLQNG
jgi:DNA-binding response OmpR family regulator